MFNIFFIIVINLFNIALALLLYVDLISYIYSYFLLFFIIFHIVYLYKFYIYLRYFDVNDKFIVYKKYFFFKAYINYEDLISIENNRLYKYILIRHKRGYIQISQLNIKFLKYYNKIMQKRPDLATLRESELPKLYYVSYIYILKFIFIVFIYLSLYFIAFYYNFLIFLFIFTISIKSLFNDLMQFKDIIIYYKIEKDRLTIKSILGNEIVYFYKYIKNIYSKKGVLNNENYLSFFYEGGESKVYLSDSFLLESMFKAFSYVEKNT